MADNRREEWQERAKAWAAASVAGKSEDDTFNRMIVDEAGIRPGEAVLDVASGTGNPGITIALAMEGDGSVTCCDFAFGMIETARGRARNLELSAMRFTCGDMRALPFADGVFDCLTCRFGIMTLADKPTAVAEAARVLRPGGRALYMVWGAYEDNPPFWVPRRTVARFFGEDEGPLPARHSMAAPGTLEDLLLGAGFARVTEKPLGYRRPVADLDAYVANGLKRSYGKKIDGLAPDQREALHAALVAAWQPFVEDGVLMVPNNARIGIGWK